MFSHLYLVDALAASHRHPPAIGDR